MPTENDTNETPSTEQSTTTQTQEQAPPEAKTEQATGDRGSKVVTIKRSDMNRMAREQRERGQLSLAKELGYNSVEEMKAAAARSTRSGARTPDRGAPPSRRDDRRPAPPAARTARPAEEPESRPAPTGKQLSQREIDRIARERAELEEKNRRLGRDKARREKEARELRRELDAKEAEMELKISAIQIGITDPDYALVLLKRHLSGRPSEELAAFNERSFFAGLRKTHPILFNEATAPANTGTGGSATEDRTETKPGAPGPKTNTAPQGNGAGALDARRMTTEELNKLLQSRGLQNPNGGPSY